MNPYLLIAVLLAFAGVGAGGFKLGVDHEIAGQKRAEDLVQKTKQEAMQGAAEEIAKVKVVNKTIQNEVRREVETNTIYRDCVVPANGVQLANQALAGSKPADSSKLPKVDAPSK